MAVVHGRPALSGSHRPYGNGTAPRTASRALLRVRMMARVVPASWLVSTLAAFVRNLICLLVAA